MKFVETAAPMQLAIYVDAAHATDLTTRRSISGMVATLNGTAIAYNAKRQPTVATSSTEAEFIAAVSAGKMCKFIRHILDEVGYPQHEPTAIYEDNAVAILMANAGKPTKRYRNIDIQYFALQEWVDRKLVKLFHIPGVVNPADALTEALGWVLHTCHVTRLISHCGSGYTSTSGHICIE